MIKKWTNIFIALLLASSCMAEDRMANSYNNFSQHFNEPDDSISPWMFIPGNNVEKITTKDHLGLASIWIGRQNEDVRGVLKKPMNVSEHRLPLQFQCSWMQNFDAMTGRSGKQINYAIGVNVAVTFSDPAAWPEDRKQRPPDTKDIQLFMVHLGNYGEVGKVLPQLETKGYPSGETYLVYGRSNFDNPVVGNWDIPHIWIGDGARYGGPASNQLFFEVTVESQTHISFGIKFDASHGWNKRHIKLSQFGHITGIWEIGPIISADRWIPDVLADELGIQGPPHVAPIDRSFEYYLDYCVLRLVRPVPFEEHSDEFNIPGYLGKWQIQEQATVVENFSNPGYLNVTLLMQVIDTSHVRLGYKAKEQDDWYMSNVCDLKEKLGGQVMQYGPHHAWSICTSPRWGGENGLPSYQRFLIDYIRYRYGLSQ